MTKQHLEGILSSSLINYNYWYLKLQVMPLAHTPMPGDYIVLTNDYNYLIECKECKNKRFDFSRLTQIKGLIKFDKSGDKFRSYLMLLFWNTNYKQSQCFLIPLRILQNFIDNCGKLSINLKDCNKLFKRCTVNFINNKCLDIDKVIL